MTQETSNSFPFGYQTGVLFPSAQGGSHSPHESGKFISSATSCTESPHEPAEFEFLTPATGSTHSPYKPAQMFPLTNTEGSLFNFPDLAQNRPMVPLFANGRLDCIPSTFDGRFDNAGYQATYTDIDAADLQSHFWEDYVY